MTNLATDIQALTTEIAAEAERQLSESKAQSAEIEALKLRVDALEAGSLKTLGFALNLAQVIGNAGLGVEAVNSIQLAFAAFQDPAPSERTPRQILHDTLEANRKEVESWPASLRNAISFDGVFDLPPPTQEAKR